MRPGVRNLMCAVLSGLAAYGVWFVAATGPTRTAARQTGAELEWLRQEYGLTAGEYAAVETLHRTYVPQSEELYRRVAAADERADRLIAGSHRVTPEVIAALSECAHVQEECRRHALAHVYAVAEHMPVAEGSRFLASMKVRILEPGAMPHTSAVHWPR